MKNVFLIFLLSTLSAAALFGQTNLSQEEATIKKVIEDEITYFMARDYDKWANCYVHSPMTSRSWLSPSAHKGSFYAVQGWDNIAKKEKARFATTPPSTNNGKNTDYQFRVTNEMAFVTFNRNNNPLQTRVLEKINGTWKILRMEASAGAHFMKRSQLHDLQRLAGSWEIDMATYKEESDFPVDWRLLHTTSEVKDVPTGVQIVTKEMYRVPSGELRTSESLTLYTMNMQTNTVAGFNSVHYPQSDWSRAYQAQGKVDKDGKLTMKGKEVGVDNSDDVEFSYWLEGDRLHFELAAMVEGKQVYAQSFQMKRKGLAKEVNP